MVSPLQIRLLILKARGQVSDGGTDLHGADFAGVTSNGEVLCVMAGVTFPSTATEADPWTIGTGMAADVKTASGVQNCPAQ